MEKELLKKLFSYTTTVDYRGTTFYLRLPSVQVVEQARKEALLRSNALRRALRNPDSEEYLVYIDPALDYTKDQLITYCLAKGLLDAAREYRQRTPKPALPKLPDYPTQEQQEEYEVAAQERETQYMEGLKAYLLDYEREYRQALEQRTQEQLFEEYRKMRTDEVCTDTFNRTFETKLMVASVFLDSAHTIPAFTEEEYAALPQAVRALFEQALSNISLTDDDLKK